MEKERSAPWSPAVSVVVPCYNEEESLPIFARELARVTEQLMELDTPPRLIELILVDDGSKDRTLEVIHDLAARDDLPYQVRWTSFSRNFGKEPALYAGLEATRGDFVATMDADMQDPPSLLPQMYADLLTGQWDSIATRRVDRVGEPPVRSAFARLFYRIINRISDADIVDGARDFRLMTRPVVDAVLAMGERNRFTKGIYGWVGFRTKWLPYENVDRARQVFGEGRRTRQSARSAKGRGRADREESSSRGFHDGGSTPGIVFGPLKEPQEFGRLDGVADRELPAGRAPMLLNGLVGNLEEIGNLLVHEAFGDKPNHVALAIGQSAPPLERVLPDPRLAASLEAEKHRPFHGVHDLFLFGRLQKKVRSAPLQGAHRHFHVPVSGEEDDRVRALLRGKLFKKLEPAQLGHADVEENAARARILAPFAQKAHRIGPGLRMEAERLEEESKRIAGLRIVVDDSHERALELKFAQQPAARCGLPSRGIFPYVGHEVSPADFARGSSSTKVRRPEASFAASIRPPCDSAMLLQIERPSPKPPAFVE